MFSNVVDPGRAIPGLLLRPLSVLQPIHADRGAACVTLLPMSRCLYPTNFAPAVPQPLSLCLGSMHNSLEHPPPPPVVARRAATVSYVLAYRVIVIETKATKTMLFVDTRGLHVLIIICVQRNAWKTHPVLTRSTRPPRQHVLDLLGERRVLLAGAPYSNWRPRSIRRRRVQRRWRCHHRRRR